MNRKTPSKKINIRPTTSVYATYKNISYHPWTAIAEFIDNSTQSYYNNESLLKSLKMWRGLNIEIELKDKKINGIAQKVLTIKDNAYGMDFKDFQRAVILDSPPKTRNRSEFGMGLKTAACWFGSNWSVESIQYGSGIKYYTEVDVQQLQRDKNEEIEVKEDICSKNEHGTTITIWGLHRDIVGRQIAKTKDTLTGTYRSDLRTGEINIFYNGEKLAFKEPQPLIEKLRNGEKKEWKRAVNFQLYHNDKEYNINGFIALREKGNARDSGFVLLRYGRAIIGGYENNYRPPAIFGAPNSFVYQRLYGELNMDDWDVTQTKDDFDWHNGLEDKFIDELKKITADYRNKARTYRKKDKTIEEVAKSVGAGLVETGKIDSYKIETTKKYDSKEIFSEHDTELRDEDEIPITPMDHSVEQFTLKVSKDRLEYEIRVIPVYNNPQHSWLTINDEAPLLSIYWNCEHTFFKTFINNSRNLESLYHFLIAFVLVEIELKEIAIKGRVPVTSMRLGLDDMLTYVVEKDEKDE